jgi:hypothetical protein
MWNHEFDQADSRKIIHFKVLKGREIGIGHSSDMNYDGNSGKITNEQVSVLSEYKNINNKESKKNYSESGWSH